jgi:anti-sigma factor RsiW
LRRLCGGCRQGLQHSRLRPLLDAYVDGELTPADRARVTAHLAVCFTCSDSAETLHLIKQSLRSRPQRAPADLAKARLRRFGEALTRTDPARDIQETW